MKDLAAQLAEACSAVFVERGFDAKWGAVKKSDRPELADFQCNGCMGAAKQAGANARELASSLAGDLAGHDLIERVDVAGPGFLNIVVRDDGLAGQLELIRQDPKHGGGQATDPETVIIDFGGPNVAKPMHVGHIRSAVIGDTLVRLMRFLGDRVIGDVHLGDWGLQMGLLIVAVMEEQPDLPYFDAGHAGPLPDEPPVDMDDLSRLYPAASQRAKDDDAYAQQAREAVARMQAGDAGYRALLQHFINVSVAALKTDYAFLDVSFDLWKGESDVDHLIQPLVSDLQARKLARLDDGAWIIDVARDSDKKDMPPVILVNSRGATGYHATDIATIVERQDTLAPDRILYVVDQRQAFHFEQVFRACDKAGIFPEDRLEHIGFGTVNGTDGKPFKTREGGTLRLSDLNALALAEAEKKIGEANLSGDIGPDERGDIAALVARASLRFADLKNQRTTNYVFELEKFSSFEGKTGPYLLYAVVRLKALLKRAAAAGAFAGAVKISEPSERKLVLALDGFSLALSLAREKRMPHYLCEHIYTVAQSFSAFYGALPIVREADPDIRAARLALCEAVRLQLETGLELLGITAPERM